jgi:molybdenum cofactor guanylyltransferase
MKIDAFILVGGRSSRFGSDKGSTLLAGKPVVDRIADAVATALPGARITLVEGNNDRLFTISSRGLPVVFDLEPGHGPVGGIQASLAYALTDWVLIVACDYPMLTSDLIRLLASKMEADLDAVVPLQRDGRPQPLCAVYRRKACLAAIDKLLRPNRSAPAVMTIVDEVETCFVPFEEISSLPGADHIFLNMNTAEDLETASKLLAAQGTGG